MLKKILVVLGSVVFLFSVFKAIEAAELPTEPFLYTQDFEEMDPVDFHTTCSAKHTVNFKGLTEEKAFSGKKSFKLDITLHEGRYVIALVPLHSKKVPIEGKLNFSGRVLVGEQSTGRVSLNFCNMVPYLRTGGAPMFVSKLGPTNGEWKLVEGDMVKLNKKSVNGIAKGFCGVTGDNLSARLNSIFVYLYGKKGTRVVVYLDNFKIEGEVPTKEAYQEEIERRWAPVKERTEEKILSWEKSLREIYQSLDSLEEKKKKVFSEGLNSLAEEITKIRKRGYIRIGEEKKMNAFIKERKDEVKDETVL